MVETSPGAQVYLDGNLAGTVDASSGEFHLSSFPAGEHKIYVQLGSVRSTERPIHVIADQTYFYTVRMPTPAGNQAPAAPVTPAQTPSLSTAAASQGAVGFPVSHRHKLGGSCKGTLSVSGANILYRTTESKDSFSFALSDVTVGLEGEDDFFVRTKAGKKYDFRPEGSVEPLDIVRAINQAAGSQ